MPRSRSPLNQKNDDDRTDKREYLEEDRSSEGRRRNDRNRKGERGQDERGNDTRRGRSDREREEMRDDEERRGGRGDREMRGGRDDGERREGRGDGERRGGRDEEKRRGGRDDRERGETDHRGREGRREDGQRRGSGRDGKGRTDFVKREPPPGGWDKPSWEPSGSLKKEELETEVEEGRKEQEKEREKPSFVPSGKLAKDTNTYKGVLIKYNEPPEAKMPKLRWRMYPFKGEENLPVIYVHRQSAYLIGRDRKIADFPIDHPSASKQHAVLQYRSLPFERADGSRGRRTRPYIIDLGSGNGTFLNGERIEAQRYYELKEKDVLRFGFSSREYVMLHEQSLETGDESDTSAEEDQLEDVVDRTGGEERLADEDDLF